MLVKHGAPPPVLRLKGFRNTFPEVQCVLNNYSISYPSDLDWIMTEDGDPIAVIQNISLSFTEVYSAVQLRDFDRLNLKGAGFTSTKIGKGGNGITTMKQGSTSKPDAKKPNDTPTSKITSVAGIESPTTSDTVKSANEKIPSFHPFVMDNINTANEAMPPFHPFALDNVAVQEPQMTTNQLPAANGQLTMNSRVDVGPELAMKPATPPPSFGWYSGDNQAGV